MSLAFAMIFLGAIIYESMMKLIFPIKLSFDFYKFTLLLMFNKLKNTEKWHLK